ncbi:MAG: SpoIIIAH-like family protein [Syntrophomonadaceae bacterium]|nr:SpoIIIAH-like family protein [Syntrophomonadaceae bacterium]
MIISMNRVKLLAIIAAIVVIPLICIGLVNYSLKTTSVPTGKTAAEPADTSSNTVVSPPLTEVQESGFLAEYRMERERVRSKEMSLLREISSNSTASAKAREAANLKLVSLADREEKEMQAEAMIKSQGFQDCAVVVTDTNISVMVESGNLAAVQQEAIKKTVGVATGNTGKSISVVKLQP